MTTLIFLQLEYAKISFNCFSSKKHEMSFLKKIFLKNRTIARNCKVGKI